MINVYPINIFPEKDITPYIYLHGVIQDEVGFDLISLDKVPELPGIYSVRVFVSETISHICSMYYWIAQAKDRGIIVFADDFEGAKYARDKYLERSAYL